MLATFALGLFAMSASLAEAQVISATAAYRGGVVTVHGRTARPHQAVTLNGFQIKRSNRAGSFQFRETRIPAHCRVRLSAGGASRQIRVRNCPPAR